MHEFKGNGKTQSQKQSGRYSESEHGKIVLCESDTSVVRLDDSVNIAEELTPDLLSIKN